MIRKIILVSEFPDAHHQLVRGLTAGQVELSLQPDLRAAASQFHAHANEPLALVVDMRQCSASEVDLLEDLSVQYPQFPKIVFPASGAESQLNRLRACNDVYIFSASHWRSVCAGVDFRNHYRRSRAHGDEVGVRWSCRLRAPASRPAAKTGGPSRCK